MLSFLIHAIGKRMPAPLPCVAVIGPRTAEVADLLGREGYKQIWQRAEPEAVLSFYQPGRLFDVIILAETLERCTDMDRSLDQLEASLADPGFLCVWTTAGTYTARSLTALMAGHGFSRVWLEDFPPEFGWPMPLPDPCDLLAIFERKKGKKGGLPSDYMKMWPDIRAGFVER